MPKSGRDRDRLADRPDGGRRQALRLLGAAAVGAATQTVLGVSCAGGGRDGAPTRVPLAELPLGERVRVVHGETPVELIRSSEGVQARSLWCTHYGCEVVWSPTDARYLGPCHDGVFDEAGRVVSGPPPRPLSEVAVRGV